MAAPKPRVDNYAALIQAIKDVLPYLILFYVIDFVIWQMAPPSRFNDANLISNIFFSSLFILGFFAIDFFRARGRQKQAQMAPAPVYVVQQPVYMPPPGYALTPIPPQGPGAPQGTPLPPSPAPYPPPYPEQPPPGSAPPSDPRRRPPEGSA